MAAIVALVVLIVLVGWYAHATPAHERSLWVLAFILVAGTAGFFAGRMMR